MKGESSEQFLRLLDIGWTALAVVFLLTMYGVSLRVKNPHLSDREIHSRVIGFFFEHGGETP
jgi:hypothetical protein